MTVDRNDPRWAAYALNEMDALDRAAFEKEIEADPEADTILDEIRETAGMLRTALEPVPVRLGEGQRDRILSAVSSHSRIRYMRVVSAAGVAALVLLGLVTITNTGLLRSRSAGSGPDLAIQQLPEPSRQAQSRFESPAPEAASAPTELADDTPQEADARTEPAPVIEVAQNTAPTPEVAEPRASEVRGGQAEAEEAFRAPSAAITPQSLLDDSAAVRDGVAKGRLSALTGQSLAAGEAVRTAAAPPPPTAPRVTPAPAEAPQAAVGRAIGVIANDAIETLASRIVDRRRGERFNTEEYGRIDDNPFYLVSEEPLATFSADVDTASYANVRRFLNQRTLPPADAVRIEEMVNYFSYDYAPPADGRLVEIYAEVASAPWNPRHRLVRIGVQGQAIERARRGASNLVFLIDVSGSMDSPDKLPLLKEGMKLLVDQLGENDRVAIAVYAGASGLVLPSTPGDQKRRLLRALDRLSAGGSTNGGAGIELAYETAVANFIEGGVNRVILATDGDFNVGVTDNGALTRLIEEKADTGVFLSVLGFGAGNLNDAGMESLADRGNGNYAYIDSIREARKVLVEEMGSTLVTIAKDVKFQVEFNPAEVNAYRLIGYENRVLENQDFNDDTRDAGEIGAGHTVTALFEVVPAGIEVHIPGVDPLRYQTAFRATDEAVSGELLTVKVRYKEPDGDTSLLIETPLRDLERGFESASTDYRFASAVAAFGMILRDSPYKGDATFDSVLAIAEDSRGPDTEGYRDEFVDLVRRARAIRDLDGNE